MNTPVPLTDQAPEKRSEAADRLDSWKEIAVYLRRDVRTVRRWEKSGGLPVHRHLHQRQASVFAYRSELDAWWGKDHKELEQGEKERSELASGRGRNTLILMGVSLVLLIGGITWWLMSSRPALSFATRSWVLVADFDNGTGDARFDRALVAPLNISLAQSQRLNVFPRSRIAETLKRMGRPENARIDAALGREICQRENVRALVLGSLTRAGSRYELTAQIVDAETGDVAAAYVERTNTEDDLLNALDSLATQLRQGLGESVYTIRKAHRPLPQVSTSSLDALKLYADAQEQWRMGLYQDAVGTYESALRLDPDFAMAHAALGSALSSFVLSEPEKARNRFEKALQLVNRTTDRERQFIAAAYQRALGDPREAVRLYLEILKSYPDDLAANSSLAHILILEGRYDEALTCLHEVLRIDPASASAYIDMATCYNGKGQYQPAIQNYEKGFALNPRMETSENLNQEYGIALIAAGEQSKAREVFLKSVAIPAQRAFGLRSLALLDMREGKYRDAVSLLADATKISEPPDPLRRARNLWFLAQALEGSGDRAGSLRALDNGVRELRSRKPVSVVFLTRFGVAYAWAGRVNEAQTLLAEAESAANEKVPEELHAINLLRGEIELANHHQQRAIEMFRLAAQALPAFDCLTDESLGRAHLAARQPELAIPDFEKVLASHTCQGWEAQQGWVLAHLHVAQAYAALNQTQKAQASLDGLLALWLEGDPTLPALNAARALRSH